MMFFLLIVLNLGAMLGAPGVVLHYTGNANWALATGAVPWLVNGFILGSWLAIVRRQKRGQTGSEMGALPFMWMFFCTPVGVVWALVVMVAALMVHG